MTWLTTQQRPFLNVIVAAMEETVEGQHGDAQAVQEIAQEHPAVSAAPVSVSNPEATAQWQQAMQHWQALQQQGQQDRPKNAPFYPVGGGHPAYSLWAGQVRLPLSELCRNFPLGLCQAAD